MATPADQLDELLTTTTFNTRPTLVDQITNENSLLAALNSKSKVTESGGTEVRRPILTELNDTVESFSDYDIVDTSPQEGFGYAVYPWKFFTGQVTISKTDELKNAGSAAIINLVTAKLEQLKLSIEDVLNGWLWADGTGNGGKDPAGLGLIVDDASTCGGIDGVTETFWQSSVVAGPVDLTAIGGIASLNNLYNTLHIARSDIDFEFTTQLNFEAYEALAAPNIRFTDVKMADLGFQAISHKRAEVIFEPDVPNDANTVNDGGYWYMLNSKHLEFVQHSSAWMTPGEWQKPYNQHARTMSVLSAGNLITDMRRAHGVIRETTV